MLNLFKNVLLFIFIISFSVFIHESGHLFFGLLFNLNIESFNIGFGKTLFQIDTSSLNFINFLNNNFFLKINLIPFGGYLELENGNDIYNLNFFQLIFFSFGGVLFNFLFIFIIMYKLKFGNNILVYIKYILFIIKNFITLKSEGLTEVIVYKKIKYPILLWNLIYINSLMVFINILPIEPLDGSKIILWLFNCFDINKNNIFYNFYGIFSLFSLFFILIYYNSSRKIQHFFNYYFFYIPFKKLLENKFQYNYKHISNSKVLFTMYQNNRIIIEKNIKKLYNINDLIDNKEYISNDELDGLLLKKEILINIINEQVLTLTNIKDKLNNF